MEYIYRILVQLIIRGIVVLAIQTSKVLWSLGSDSSVQNLKAWCLGLLFVLA